MRGPGSGFLPNPATPGPPKPGNLTAWPAANWFAKLLLLLLLLLLLVFTAPLAFFGFKGQSLLLIRLWSREPHRHGGEGVAGGKEGEGTEADWGDSTDDGAAVSRGGEPLPVRGAPPKPWARTWASTGAWSLNMVTPITPVLFFAPGRR